MSNEIVHSFYCAICGNQLKIERISEVGTVALAPCPFCLLDTSRLDYLQSLTKGYGRGWLLRESTTGRGMRLHETSSEMAAISVRAAIDACMARERGHKQ